MARNALIWRNSRYMHTNSDGEETRQVVRRVLEARRTFGCRVQIPSSPSVSCLLTSRQFYGIMQLLLRRADKTLVRKRWPPLSHQRWPFLFTRDGNKKQEKLPVRLTQVAFILSPDFVPVDLHQRGRGCIIMQFLSKCPVANSTQEGIITAIFITTKARRQKRV